MIRILLISTTFWVFSLIIYRLLLKKLTFHHLNRWYLLISMVLGVILPFVPIPSGEETPFVVYLSPIIVGLNEATSGITPVIPEPGFHFWPVLPWLYFGLVLFHIIKMIRSIYLVWRQTINASFTQKENVFIVSSPTIEQPHSFFKWIFVNELDPPDPIIIEHEYAHIKGGHSWDKLLIQTLAAIYWIVPVFLFFRRYINEIHEYIADEYVLKSTGKKKYSYFLLGQTVLGVHPLSNNFHSLIKNRITMILQKKSNAHSRLWYLPVMALLAGMATIILISCDKEQEKMEDILREEAPIAQHLTLVDTIIVFDPETYTETVNIVKTELEVYDKLDQMPLFSLEGCDGKDSKEQYDCANMNLLKFIYTNIKYPDTRDREGLVVLKFIVNKEGYLIHPEIIRSIGENYSKEVLRVFNKLDDHQWIPGSLNGENKAVYFNLPIKFKLE